jgi:hypothetical protein
MEVRAQGSEGLAEENQLEEAILEGLVAVRVMGALVKEARVGVEGFVEEGSVAVEGDLEPAAQFLVEEALLVVDEA